MVLTVCLTVAVVEVGWRGRSIFRTCGPKGETEVNSVTFLSSLGIRTAPLKGHASEYGRHSLTPMSASNTTTCRAATTGHE